MPYSILNIAAGKFQPIHLDLSDDPYFLVNLDTMYYQYNEPDVIENAFSAWSKTMDKTFHCNRDAFEFMERTRLKFDLICIYRFLEHISFTQVEYFIYLLSTILHPGGEIDVIVPNYTTLAKMILSDNVYDSDFDANNIILTTELLNDPACPHASIWTAERVKYFFELEKRFKINSIDTSYTFDGRDIYLRFIVERI